MISRRAPRRFVARPFILFRIQDAPDISGKIHFGFQSLQTISGAPRRAESCRRKSYVVDLTDGANRLQPPLTRRTSKPPWLYERRRIPVRKKETWTNACPMGEGKTKRETKLSDRRISGTTVAKERRTRRVVPEINCRPRCHNLAGVVRKKLVQYGAAGSFFSIVHRRS